MSLQLALTQLESLAEMLNERKREAEQYQAFRDTLKQINTKFALRGLGDGNRFLLKQDNVTQLVSFWCLCFWRVPPVRQDMFTNVIYSCMFKRWWNIKEIT